MTFEEFQASRVWSDDLATDIADVFVGDPGPPVAGWVYPAHMSIEHVGEHWPAQARAQGKWYLLIENHDWISDDLEALERELFEYAQGEGIA